MIFCHVIAHFQVYILAGAQTSRIVYDGFRDVRGVRKVPKSTHNALALQFAKRLMDVRLARNWTRDMLAKRSGVNVHTLKHFERTGQIALPRLIALCDALGMLNDFVRAFKPRQRVCVDHWQVKHATDRDHL